MSRYQFIAACIEAWPVQLLCRVLAGSPAGYTSGGNGRLPRRYRGRRRRKRPLRATPAVTAPAGYEPNCMPKGTQWGVMCYAPGCTAKDCGP